MSTKKQPIWLWSNTELYTAIIISIIIGILIGYVSGYGASHKITTETYVRG